ncbi:MAG: hypothetical protein ACR2PR_09160 [Pseudohongiellaceae bacterium]
MDSVPAVRLGWLIAQIRLLISDPAEAGEVGTGGSARIKDEEIADIAFSQMLAMPTENAGHFNSVFGVFKEEGEDGDISSWAKWVFTNFRIPANKPDIDPNARDDEDYPLTPIPPNEIWNLQKRILTVLGLRDTQVALDRHLILTGAGHGALLAASGRTAQK